MKRLKAVFSSPRCRKDSELMLSQEEAAPHLEELSEASRKGRVKPDERRKEGADLEEVG